MLASRVMFYTSAPDVLQQKKKNVVLRRWEL